MSVVALACFFCAKRGIFCSLATHLKASCLSSSMALSSDHSAPRAAQLLFGDRRKSSLKCRCAQPHCRKEGAFPAPRAEQGKQQEATRDATRDARREASQNLALLGARARGKQRVECVRRAERRRSRARRESRRRRRSTLLAHQRALQEERRKHNGDRGNRKSFPQFCAKFFAHFLAKFAA